jgi:hypothetical protein
MQDRRGPDHLPQDDPGDREQPLRECDCGGLSTGGKSVTAHDIDPMLWFRWGVLKSQLEYARGPRMEMLHCLCEQSYS